MSPTSSNLDDVAQGAAVVRASPQAGTVRVYGTVKVVERAVVAPVGGRVDS